VGQAAGVLEQMAEGQEQLRAELGLVAERLEQLEQGQARLEAAQAAPVAPERRSGSSRAPLWVAIVAAVLAAGALAVTLLSP
jgi:hypothetical protein